MVSNDNTNKMTKSGIGICIAYSPQTCNILASKMDRSNKWKIIKRNLNHINHADLTYLQFDLRLYGPEVKVKKDIK